MNLSMGSQKMLFTKLLVATSFALFGQTLGARDLTSDITVAKEQLDKAFVNAREFQPHVANFQQVIFADITPYAHDIQRRMLALGIDPVRIEEQAILYNTSLSEIQVITVDIVNKIGSAYFGPISKTIFDLDYNIDAPTLTQDVQVIEENHAVFHADFDAGVAEIDQKITNLFEFNWLLIQGTSGPDREAINADLDFIYVATTSYRDDLIAHMASLDVDVQQAIAATNVVIAQL